MPILNPSVTIICPACGTTADLRDPALYGGCRRCRSDGKNTNFEARVPLSEVEDGIRGAKRSEAAGLWRWGRALPILDADGISLGEGDTHAFRLPSLRSRWGPKELWLKNETANPTWSHKDRLAAVTVAAAAALSCRGVVGASSGNHGAALAAFCARAGLECELFATKNTKPSMLAIMRSYGATVTEVDLPEDRYASVSKALESGDWLVGTNATYPPVGSNPLGIAGYKTIAYEIATQYGRSTVPDVIMVPVSYGDCVAGLVCGLQELQAIRAIEQVPRVIAVEVSGAITRHLDSSRPISPFDRDHTPAFSIATPSFTWQTVNALAATNGDAIQVSDSELLAAQLLLAQSEGILAEAASAAALAAVPKALRFGLIGTTERVMVLCTASGIKDLGTISDWPREAQSSE